MYETIPIRLTQKSSREKEYDQRIYERDNRVVDPFVLDFLERVPVVDPYFEDGSVLFTEAVFTKGRKTMEPVVRCFQKIKDLLDESIKKDGSKFNPDTFVKNLAFKELEDTLKDIFGFRNVELMHWRETYNPKTKEFSAFELNCVTWTTWRYPIDGLVTDKGFYDSTHSINTTISYSLGKFQKCTAEQLTATFLHELGHNIDPALVDIKYVETNAISKYLTDRTESMSKQEEMALKRRGPLGIAADLVIAGGLAVTLLPRLIIRFIRRQKWDSNKELEKIRQLVRNDKSDFHRTKNIEAFADNFARMYGFGPELTQGFLKAKTMYAADRKSRIQKEKDRQMVIAYIVKATLDSRYKSDIHRVHALIKEYEIDLKDPKLPKKVKTQIQEDMEEVKKVLNKYLTSFDEFENRVNQMILEELELKDQKSDSKTS